jgi:hypothetical protein
MERGTQIEKITRCVHLDYDPRTRPDTQLDIRGVSGLGRICKIF